MCAPSKCSVPNPVSGSTKHTWSDTWTHPQGYRAESGSSMHASLQEISWWSLHVKGTSALEAKVLAAVARNSWHPNQTSSDVHCQVDKLVSEKDQLYNKVFQALLPPHAFPQMTAIPSSALLWIDPTQGKGPLLTWLVHPVIKEKPQPAGRNKGKLSKH